MPATKLPTVNGELGTNYGNGTYAKGSAGTAYLQAAYKTSPIVLAEDPLVDDGTLDATKNPIRISFQDLVMDGSVSNGFMFAEFSRDYVGGTDSGTAEASQVPPDYSLEYAAAGDPANSWVPNPSSPTEGVNPTTLQKPPAGWAAELVTKAGNTPFEGDGSQAIPSETSAAISAMTIGSYLLKKSTV